MRRHYIDNLRTALVLLLIPYHAFMLYNNWGEGFYVYSQPLEIPSLLVTLIWPWFMPALFVLAGVSTAYSLERRSIGHYVRERVTRLFVPLVLGVLFIIPVQTYYAERFHNGYTGSYLAQYRLFFGKVTDLTGYTGGFTPGQLWFIFYLFLISLLAVPVLIRDRKRKPQITKPLSYPLLIILGLPVLALNPLLNIGGKSFAEYSAYFFLGYRFLSRGDIAELLERKYRVTGILAAMALALYTLCVVNGVHDWPSWLPYQLYAWTTILFLFGLFKRYLIRAGALARYLARASFSVYVLHQSLLVGAGYYLIPLGLHPAVEMVLIIFATILLTYGLYEIWRRFSGFITRRIT